jgi:probable HAF family extracellular repeat protein
MSKWFAPHFLAAVVLLSGTGRALAEYILTDLGSMLGGTPVPYSINNAGQVTGFPAPSGHAQVYSSGKMLDLGTLPGSSASWASGISDAGQVVGSASFSMDGLSTHAFLYSGGKWTDLGSLGGNNTNAVAVNASGQVVGNSNGRAFLYSGEKMIDLRAPGGYSSATAINAAGQLVGFANQLRSELPRAFLYSGGKMTDLGVLNTPGTVGSYSAPAGINSSGQVVGLSGGHAFLYSGGKMTDLGAPRGNGGFTPTGINDAGQIVGASGRPGGISHAFLYSGGQWTDLNSVLVASKGWLLLDARGINDRGQIVGLATPPGGGGPHGYLLTPAATAPEPTSLALLSVGALGLAGHAWRKRRRARAA